MENGSGEKENLTNKMENPFKKQEETLRHDIKILHNREQQEARIAEQKKRRKKQTARGEEPEEVEERETKPNKRYPLSKNHIIEN